MTEATNLTVIDTGHVLPPFIQMTHYRHKTWCANCGDLHYLYIPKGTTIKSGLKGIECQRCGCLVNGELT